MEDTYIFVLVLLTCVSAKPVSRMLRMDDDFGTQDFENFILESESMGGLPQSTMLPLVESTTSNDVSSIREEKGRISAQALRNLMRALRRGPGFDSTSVTTENIQSTTVQPETTQRQTDGTPQPPTTLLLETTTVPYSPRRQSGRIASRQNVTSLANRQARQEEEPDEEEPGGPRTTQRPADDVRESRQEEESQEEEGGGGGPGFGGIISAFLGTLSTPEGGVDVDAVVGLLGSLSKQNDDGSYDFSGLTETLMNFFGTDEEGGGGSDIGRFLGGLVGAFIKGVASPPGPKGAGIFTGKILGQILPALSGPAPPKEGATTSKSQHLDAGSYVKGLLGSLSEGSNGTSYGNAANRKFVFLKTLISIITSILTSSSAYKH